MPETSETAESEKIGPDDLEKKKIKLQWSDNDIMRTNNCVQRKQNP